MRNIMSRNKREIIPIGDIELIHSYWHESKTSLKDILKMIEKEGYSPSDYENIFIEEDTSNCYYEGDAPEYRIVYRKPLESKK